MCSENLKLWFPLQYQLFLKATKIHSAQGWSPREHVPAHQLALYMRHRRGSLEGKREAGFCNCCRRLTEKGRFSHLTLK